MCACMSVYMGNRQCLQKNVMIVLHMHEAKRLAVIRSTADPRKDPMLTFKYMKLHPQFTNPLQPL